MDVVLGLWGHREAVGGKVEEAAWSKALDGPCEGCDLVEQAAT